LDEAECPVKLDEVDDPVKQDEAEYPVKLVPVTLEEEAYL